jgi:multiple sugar transport system substrate-binding protein
MKRKLTICIALLLCVALMPIFSSGAAEQASQAGAKKFSGVTIRVLGDQRSEVAKLMELTPQFEAETGMKVEYIIMGEAALDEKVALEFSARSTNIDVSFLKFFLLKDYANKGFLEPINLHQSSPDSFSQFSEAVLDIGRVGENLYGIPQMIDPNILTYRADIFAQYGLKVPQTMDELMETAKFITEKVPGMYGVVARGSRSGRPNWNWSSFLFAFGGRYLDDNGYPTINTPEAVKALEYYTELLTKYGPPGVSDYNWQDVQDSVASGSVAMMYDGATLAKRIADPVDPAYSKYADKFSFAVVPEGPAKRESGYFSWMLVVPEGAKDVNKDAAVAYIEWAFSDEIAKKAGWGAAAEDLYDIKAYDGFNESRNMKDVYNEALEYTSQDYRPLIPQLAQLMDIVDLAINMSLAGIKDPKSALDEAQAQLVKLLVK